MRIQHNITAMNAYRNYNNNTSKVGKNLEKLSSGYRINRAGDDAAGLAVSQKMRLQIAGLAQAQKNAKSGISYVQTAEGALTEVHDMLERMYTLAEQSANGTFDDSTDRVQLQKEMDKLSEEINRIGQTANFNGQGIFAEYVGGNGVTGGTGSGGKTQKIEYKAIEAVAPEKTAIEDATAATAAGTVTVSLGNDTTVDISDGKSTISVKLSDGSELSIQLANNSATLNAVCNGKSFALGGGATTDGKTSASSIAAIVKEVLAGTESFTDGSTISVSGADIKSNANEAGMNGVYVSEITVNSSAGKKYTSEVKDVKAGSTDKDKNLDFASITIFDGSQDLDKCSFTIDGKEFVVVKKSKSSLVTDSDITKIEVEDTDTMTAAVVKDTILPAIEKATGLDFHDANGTKILLSASGSGKGSGGSGGSGGAGGGNGGGVSFWIGAENIATSDGVAVNRLTLDSMNLSTSGMGIEGSSVAMGNVADVDITTADNAMAALTAIKSASDAVSDMRGTLGAMQNRLDHTINNLSVMQENMQDAESVVRDTDVADEMMAYTKNNILIQSAQAMLAQANQLPQGVLQLLQ